MTDNFLMPPDPPIGTDEEMLAQATQVRDAAEADPNYLLKCVQGEKVFYNHDHKARLEGHIYSSEGRREFSMSGACEWHFDHWFDPDLQCPPQDAAPDSFCNCGKTVKDHA